jgi:hypothetical protein
MLLLGVNEGETVLRHLLKYSPSSVIVYFFYFSLWLIISLSTLVLIMR